MQPQSSTSLTGIYIHIPFCKRICPYCDFYKFTTLPQLEASLINGIEKEISAFTSQWPLSARSIYLGGGTPSELTHSGLTTLMTAIRNTITVPKDCEITIEVNPESISRETTKALIDLGFTRISIGVQSFIDSELRFLGREHTRKSAIEAIQTLQLEGLTNINCDLMISLPQAEPDSLQYNLSTLIELQPMHVSIYSLTIEPKTQFAAAGITAKSTDQDTEFYHTTINYLGNAGYDHYEISAFAKPGFQSIHNSGYWNYTPTLGFGPGAHSFFQNRRWENPRHFKRYVANPTTAFQTAMNSPLSPLSERITEFILVQLRQKSGLNLTQFHQEFSVDFYNIFNSKIDFLIKNNLVVHTRERLVATTRGRDMLDTITIILLEALENQPNP